MSINRVAIGSGAVSFVAAPTLLGIISSSGLANKCRLETRLMASAALVTLVVSAIGLKIANKSKEKQPLTADDRTTIITASLIGSVAGNIALVATITMLAAHSLYFKALPAAIEKAMQAVLRLPLAWITPEAPQR